MSTAIKTPPEVFQTIHLTDENTIGIEEYLEKNKDNMTSRRYHRMKQGVRVGRLLTRLTILNETPRVIGKHDGKYMVFPFFKVRTMPIMSEEQRNKLHDMHKSGTHNKHRHDHGRTRIGKLLARKSLDELLMVNMAIGTTKLFGLVRAPLVGEIESKNFADASHEFGMTPDDAVEAMTGNVGEFTVAGHYGARIQDRFGRWLWMQGLTTTLSPSRTEVLRSHLHPRFRQQTGGNEEAAVRSEQYAQMVYQNHLPELETTPVIKLEPLPIIVD